MHSERGSIPEPGAYRQAGTIRRLRVRSAASQSGRIVPFVMPVRWRRCTGHPQPMSYLALARKWRPRTFSELVGQEHVVKALRNALDTGRVHHAFLFTGTRGVGKTTIARIFAKSLNCESGVSSEPCGQCPVCLEVDAGRFVDLIEIDAASHTGVDDVRELIDSAQYAPVTRTLQGVPHRRSAHAVEERLQCVAENAGRAA
jgi:hypothetical protein